MSMYFIRFIYALLINPKQNFSIVLLLLQKIFEWNDITGHLHYDSTEHGKYIYPPSNETPTLLGWDFIDHNELRKSCNE